MSHFIVRQLGGKDSLVVWHEYKQAHPDTAPLLLYVADGLEEYSRSDRLQQLVAKTGDALELGTCWYTLCFSPDCN